MNPVTSAEARLTELNDKLDEAVLMHFIVNARLTCKRKFPRTFPATGITPELYYRTRAEQELHIAHLDRTIARLEKLIKTVNTSNGAGAHV
jgi:hypothetical protein